MIHSLVVQVMTVLKIGMKVVQMLHDTLATMRIMRLKKAKAVSSLSPICVQVEQMESIHCLVLRLHASQIKMSRW